MVRAVRGATTVKENTEKEMLDAAEELLKEMTLQNDIQEDDIISIIFSVTSDLNAAFPAVAARRLGWNNTALMCTYEVDVPGSLKSCIRVLMHINTDKEKDDLRFIYLKEARALRPDIA
ncbi:MAG: chorismate mutase [Clostridiaceae bacterium]|jgi:chorismate mutase|nr:chorismate mutase [Clostridiaceae bacterium]